MRNANQAVIDESGSVASSGVGGSSGGASRGESGGGPIRVGAVSYLNTLPLIEGLGKLDALRLTLTAPAKLIDLLFDDSEVGVELALASVVDVQRAPEPVVLIPSGMIGCSGETLTVRLFSSVPFEEATTLAADADSHTSVALARIILDRRFGARPEVTPFDSEVGADGSGGENPETLLLIGDKVMAQEHSAYPYQLDLGSAWHEWTGLPFVYACWMARESSFGDPVSAERIALAATVLDRQRRHNAMRTDWIVATRAESRGWSQPDARRYLGELLDYEVTDAHRAGVERFFEEAHALGLLGKTLRPVAWA